MGNSLFFPPFISLIRDELLGRFASGAGRRPEFQIITKCYNPLVSLVLKVKVTLKASFFFFEQAIKQSPDVRTPQG